MKKTSLKMTILNLLLCSCIVLCSCTNNSETSTDASDETSINDSSITEETPSEEMSSTKEITSEEENLVNIRYDMINIEETLLVENEDFSYKIIDIDPNYDNYGNTEYAIVAEHIFKAEDPKTEIFFDHIIVNGVQCNFTQSWNNEGSGWITLNYIELSKKGITDITDITIVYGIGEGWDHSGERKELHIYPYGEENAVQYTHQDSADEIIIIDNEDVKICASDLLGSSYYNILIENKTNDELDIDLWIRKINGYDTYSELYSRIYPNTYEFLRFIPSLSTIIDNNITQINSIEFEIIINSNYDSAETITLDTNITLNTIEHPIPSEPIETTNFDNYDALAEYTLTLNQSVATVYDFSYNGTNTQTILYNGAHYELGLSSFGSYTLCVFTPKTAIALDCASDEVYVIPPDAGDIYPDYYLSIDTTETEIVLPITILHEDGTLEKMTLYLTLK